VAVAQTLVLVGTGRQLVVVGVTVGVIVVLQAVTVGVTVGGQAELGTGFFLMQSVFEPEGYLEQYELTVEQNSEYSRHLMAAGHPAWSQHEAELITQALTAPLHPVDEVQVGRGGAHQLPTFHSHVGAAVVAVQVAAEVVVVEVVVVDVVVGGGGG
jgi:hypothetical protein